MNSSQINTLLKEVAYQVNIDFQNLLESNTQLNQKPQGFNTTDTLRNTARKGGLIKSFDTRNDTGSKIEFNSTGANITFGSNLVYSGVHEFGAKIPVTNKMRKFFWAKYMTSKDVMWKILALKKTPVVNIKPRPYFNKSLKELEDTLNDTIREIFLSKVTLD